MNKNWFVVEITRLMWVDTGWGNGYVVIPKWHPYYGIDYNKIPVEVHGGLTFSEYGKNMRQHYKCEIPEWVKDDDYIVWFDTAHYMDNSMNWPKSKVEQETVELARQIKNLSSKKIDD